MTRTILTLAAAALGLAALPAAAQAQPWQSIDARQDRLYGRIEQGVRNGQLTRREAANLRGRYAGLVRLERDYRRGGLSGRERADLNRRYDALSSSIRWQRGDGQHRRRG